MNYDVNCDMGIITYQAFFNVFIKSIQGQRTRTVRIHPHDSVKDLRDRLYKDLFEHTLGYDADELLANYKKLLDEKNVTITFQNKMLEEEGRTLQDYEIEKDSTLWLGLNILGGMPKRAASSSENPFEQVEYTNCLPEHRQIWENTFHHASNINTMTDIDLAETFKNSSSQRLYEITQGWNLSKSRNMDKLMGLSSFLDHTQQMELVTKMIKCSIEKYKRLMSRRLWDSGVVKGKFHMDVLLGVLMGFAAATTASTSGQPAPL